MKKERLRVMAREKIILSHSIAKIEDRRNRGNGMRKIQKAWRKIVTQSNSQKSSE